MWRASLEAGLSSRPDPVATGDGDQDLANIKSIYHVLGHYSSKNYKDSHLGWILAQPRSANSRLMPTWAIVGREQAD